MFTRMQSSALKIVKNFAWFESPPIQLDNKHKTRQETILPLFGGIFNWGNFKFMKTNISEQYIVRSTLSASLKDQFIILKAFLQNHHNKYVNLSRFGSTRTGSPENLHKKIIILDYYPQS